MKTIFSTLLFFGSVSGIFSLCAPLTKLTATPSEIRSFDDGSASNLYYSHSLDCSWMILASDQYHVVLQFYRFDIEKAVDRNGKCYDFVEIFDGADENAASFGHFCGNLRDRVNHKFRSSGRPLFVKFHTDRLNANKGFAVSYWAHPVSSSLINGSEEVSHHAVKLANVISRMEDLEHYAKEYQLLLNARCPGNCSGNGDCFLQLNLVTFKWLATCVCKEFYLPPTCSRKALGDDGRDGSKIITTSTVINNYMQFSGSKESSSGHVRLEANWIAPGSDVLLIQMQGANAGQYEIQQITDVSGKTVSFENVLKYTYSNADETGARAQLISVPKFRTLTIESGGAVQAKSYDGSTGGIVVFKAVTLHVETGGKIDVSSQGFRGASRKERGNWIGLAGESYLHSGFPATKDIRNNGGGGGSSVCHCGESAGSGSYGSVGSSPSRSSCSGHLHGQNGATYGSADLSRIHLGSGGGGGCRDNSNCEFTNGANGGGIVLIEAGKVVLKGKILSNGGDASGGPSSTCDGTIGGAASGGSIYLKTISLSSCYPGFAFAAKGGGRTFISQPQVYGSSGGEGRVRVDYSVIDGRHFELDQPEVKVQQEKYSNVGFWGISTE